MKRRFAGWAFSARRFGVQKHYLAVEKRLGGACGLCHLHEWHNQILQETPHFNLIKNEFPYYFWESRRVSQHLLLVPKRHILSISELTADEWADFQQILTQYEPQGFSIYARAPANPQRTQVHQHTHLIKVGTGKAIA
jgi:diadenosine tetraphosphate (Ap4A) HIT family hydrolase